MVPLTEVADLQVLGFGTPRMLGVYYGSCASDKCMAGPVHCLAMSGSTDNRMGRSGCDTGGWKKGIGVCSDSVGTREASSIDNRMGRSGCDIGGLERGIEVCSDSVGTREARERSAGGHVGSSDIMKRVIPRNSAGWRVLTCDVSRVRKQMATRLSATSKHTFCPGGHCQ